MGKNGEMQGAGWVRQRNYYHVELREENEQPYSESQQWDEQPDSMTSVVHIGMRYTYLQPFLDIVYYALRVLS